MAKKEKESTQIKFSDFIGRKLIDISNDDKGTLTIKFDNGYNINITGNISLIKKKEE